MSAVAEAEDRSTVRRQQSIGNIPTAPLPYAVLLNKDFSADEKRVFAMLQDWSRNHPVRANGYFPGPGVQQVAHWLGRRDREAGIRVMALLCSHELIDKQRPSTRERDENGKRVARRFKDQAPTQKPERVVGQPDEIVFLALPPVDRRTRDGRVIALDGWQGGRAEIPLPLLFDMRLDAAAICVYADIVRFAAGSKIAFPTKKTLANDIGIGESRVAEGLDQLRAVGYLAWLRRGLQESNVYILPSHEDFGQPLWSLALSQFSFHELARAGQISFSDSGEIVSPRLSFEDLKESELVNKVGERTNNEKEGDKREENEVISATAPVRSVVGISTVQAVGGDVNQAVALPMEQVVGDPTVQVVGVGTGTVQVVGDSTVPVVGNPTVQAVGGITEPVVRDSDIHPQPFAPVVGNPTVQVVGNGGDIIDSRFQTPDSRIQESPAPVRVKEADPELDRAYATVWQMSQDYADNPQSNDTQIKAVWRQAHTKYAGQLPTVGFYQMVAEAASYVRSIPQDKRRGAPLAAFFGLLLRKLEKREWMRGLKRQGKRHSLDTESLGSPPPGATALPAAQYVSAPEAGAGNVTATGTEDAASNAQLAELARLGQVAPHHLQLWQAARDELRRSFQGQPSLIAWVEQLRLHALLLREKLPEYAEALDGDVAILSWPANIAFNNYAVRYGEQVGAVLRQVMELDNLDVRMGAVRG